MSTRSNIAIKIKEEDKGKTFKAWNNVNFKISEDTEYLEVYCHFDGYLEGVGADLLSDFNNYDDVFNLIIKGDMSSINDYYYDRPHEEDWDDIKPNELKTFDFNKKIPNDYYYLFENNKWIYRNWNDDEWHDLK